MGVRAVAVETPVCVRWDLPDASLRIPSGHAAFSFERRVLAGACEFGSIRGRRQLAWRLEPGEPTRLLAQLLDRRLTTPVDAALVEFEAPLLGAVGCAGTTDGACLVAISSDGSLHVLRLSARDGALAIAHGGTSLVDVFARHGAPTALEMCGGSACIGTSGGAVLSVSAEAPSADACVELKGLQTLSQVRRTGAALERCGRCKKATRHASRPCNVVADLPRGGLCDAAPLLQDTASPCFTLSLCFSFPTTQFITSLVSFSPSKTSPVAQLFVYNYLDRCFLCSTHEDCTMRCAEATRQRRVELCVLRRPALQHQRSDPGVFLLRSLLGALPGQCTADLADASNSFFYSSVGAGSGTWRGTR